MTNAENQWSSQSVAGWFLKVIDKEPNKPERAFKVLGGSDEVIWEK